MSNPGAREGLALSLVNILRASICPTLRASALAGRMGRHRVDENVVRRPTVVWRTPHCWRAASHEVVRPAVLTKVGPPEAMIMDAP